MEGDVSTVRIKVTVESAPFGPEVLLSPGGSVWLEAYARAIGEAARKRVFDDFERLGAEGFVDRLRDADMTPHV